MKKRFIIASVAMALLTGCSASEDVENAKKALEEGASPQRVIAAACTSGKMDVVEYIQNEKQVKLESRNYFNAVAAVDQKGACMDYMLANGINVPQGLILEAVNKKNMHTFVPALIDSGATVSEADLWGLIKNFPLAKLQSWDAAKKLPDFKTLPMYPKDLSEDKVKWVIQNTTELSDGDWTMIVAEAPVESLDALLEAGGNPDFEYKSFHRNAHNRDYRFMQLSDEKLRWLLKHPELLENAIKELSSIVDLHNASLETFELLLDTYPGLLHKRDPIGSLIYVEKGSEKEGLNRKKVALLIEKGSFHKVDVLEPLAELGWIDLLEKEIKSFNPDKKVLGSLYSNAFNKKSSDMMRFLRGYLGKDAEKFVSQEDLRRQLITSVSCGKDEISDWTKFLVEELKVNVVKPDFYGPRSAISTAVASGKLEAVKYLVAHGATLDTRTHHHTTTTHRYKRIEERTHSWIDDPLYYALEALSYEKVFRRDGYCKLGSEEMVDYLLNAGVKNSLLNIGEYTIEELIRYKRLDIVKKLVEKGVSVKGQALLETVYRMGENDFAAFLKKNGAI
ncbi:hypothetical protein [Mariprofundus sp. KV]|uniref:hypothetical protein n=1 Tax=Mariprofundus sp. KV TaxID=2608715 RepID=UPI0015A04596|nr:hypothetical protein [Mariprofundus sp. KV]NWF36180.1 ankyrin repeat domain-containing protein [Mariprofundus sp. KV]